MDSAEALGLNVLRSDPRQRAFSQPCPLWHGQCTIYTSPHYPRFCGTYKCKLLKEVIDEITPLPDALTLVEQAKVMIDELKTLLPSSPNPNFRERLVAYLESPSQSSGPIGTDPDLRRQKANVLLIFYEKVCGVKDVVDQPDEE